MNHEAVYRTAPATPGLLNIYNWASSARPIVNTWYVCLVINRLVSLVSAWYATSLIEGSPIRLTGADTDLKHSPVRSVTKTRELSLNDNSDTYPGLISSSPWISSLTGLTPTVTVFQSSLESPRQWRLCPRGPTWGRCPRCYPSPPRRPPSLSWSINNSPIPKIWASMQRQSHNRMVNAQVTAIPENPIL